MLEDGEPISQKLKGEAKSDCGRGEGEADCVSKDEESANQAGCTLTMGGLQSQGVCSTWRGSFKRER